MAGIEDLGTSLGYIYVVEPDKATIVKAIANDPTGARNVKLEGVKAQSVALNRIATATFIVAAPTGSGTIKSITINSREQIDIASPIPYTVATTAIALATLITTAINGFSGVVIDCTADQDGVNVIVKLPQSIGSDYNGSTGIVVDSGNLAIPEATVVDGSNATELYDTSIGYTFFLNANYDASGCGGSATLAVENSLTNAIEITEYIVPRSLTSALDKQEVEITSGAISYDRKSAITTLVVDTQASAGTDDLDTISVVGLSEGDRIIIVGAAVGQVVTVKDGTGNIELQGSVDFVSGVTQVALSLQLIGGTWYETSRSTQTIGSTADYRTAGFGIFGIEDRGTQVVVSSGNVTWDPATDGKYQDITGSSTLGAGVNYLASGTPKDGDEIWIRYDAQVTIGGFGITIYGVPLTAEQALQGGLIIYSRYLGAVDSWQSMLYPNMDSALTNTFQSTTEFYKNESVTVPKVETSLKTELRVLPISWDTNRIGDHKIVLPFPCTVTQIEVYADDLIEATDDADVNFKNNAGLSMGTQTLTAGTTIGSGVSLTPSSNNTFTAGQVLTATTTKSSAGGNAKVSLTILKS
jgi:hypothetical protein